MAKPFANSGDPDQTPHSATSNLGLHCLPVTLLGVSRLQWVNLYLTYPKLVRPFNLYHLMDKINGQQIDDSFLVFPRKRIEKMGKIRKTFLYIVC